MKLLVSYGADPVISTVKRFDEFAERATRRRAIARRLCAASGYLVAVRRELRRPPGRPPLRKAFAGNFIVCPGGIVPRSSISSMSSA